VRPGLIALCLLASGPALAQEPSNRAAVAAAQCVGLALSAGLPAQAGVPYLFRRPVHAARLDLSPWLIEDKRPVPAWQDNASEAMAYDFVLVRANELSVEALAHAARRDLTFAHFFEEADKYRGEIVRVEGVLRRVRRFDPDRLTRKEGVHHVYEGWLFNPKLYGTNPLCLVFTELPPNLHVGEALGVPAAFDGFFFKRYRYQAGDKWRDAPLLIGHSPVLLPAPLTPVEEGLSNNTQLVIVFLGVLAGTLCLALALAWWYHHGDRRLRARLSSTHAIPFVDPSERRE
jgi:hypothetical protein